MKAAVILFGLLLGTTVFGQAPSPTLGITAVPKQVIAGSKLTFHVIFTFAPGFHGYQNPPAQDYEIPVTVKIDGKEFKVLKIAYPPGIDAKIGGNDKSTKAYEGEIKIPVTLSLPQKPGVRNVKVTVSYQQCDESSCFPPGDVSSTFKVNVVKKATKG